MFGYHDNDRCGFDLWSPVDDQCGKLDTIYTKFCSQLEDQGENLDTITHLYDQCEDLDTIYTHPHSKPGFPRATENRAFSPYAKHMQEVEDVISMIIDNFDRGNMNMSFELDDDFSESDLNYIRQKVYQARGVYF